VKRYSSGMYVRLAFAVAAHLEPEILLVDEVLAVGDAEFQKKCLGKMGEVAKGGRTVLFVSHNMGAIRALCPKTMLLEQGAVMDLGETGLVTAAYLTRFQRGFEQTANNGDSVVIEKVELKNTEGINTVSFAPGSDLIVEIHYNSSQRFELPYFWVGAYGRYGPVFAANMLFDGCRPDYIDGRGIIRCTFREIPLLPTTYTIKMGCRDRNGTTLLMQTKDVGFFEVSGRLHDIGFHGEIGESLLHDSCTVAIPYDWTFPDGTVHPVRIHNPKNNGSRHE
jgi:lipopolysaccharide transport system ATP-binding protein